MRRLTMPCAVSVCLMLCVAATAAEEHLVLRKLGPVARPVPERAVGVPETDLQPGEKSGEGSLSKETLSDARSDDLERETLHGRADVFPILEEILRASGVDDPRLRASYTRTFGALLARLQKHVASPRSQYRRARRLHDYLHRHVLRTYVPTADGIEAILDRGEYNCVSATLLYGIVARGLGLDMSVVETPRHIFLRFDSEGRVINIETTSPMGFDFSGDLEKFRRFTSAYTFSLATIAQLERRGPYARFDQFEEPVEGPVSLERATAFLWHNTAERALARGEALKAASAFSQEFRAHPDLAMRLDEFATSLARAFRMEYEDGRFDTAFQIASIELQAFPRRTSSRDRMLAAATKRIEAACQAGDQTRAESILNETARTITVGSDLGRLEHETCPLIAVAAVRNDDWQSAHRMALRFAAVEPDSVEAARFIGWIEDRKANAGNSERADTCWEPSLTQRRRNSFAVDSGALPPSEKAAPPSESPR